MAVLALEVHQPIPPGIGELTTHRGVQRSGRPLPLVDPDYFSGGVLTEGDSKALAETYDFATMRNSILIPLGVEDASLRTDGPFAYRDLDECLALIGDYVDVVARFAVVGYMGHL